MIMKPGGAGGPGRRRGHGRPPRPRKAAAATEGRRGHGRKPGDASL